MDRVCGILAVVVTVASTMHYHLAGVRGGSHLLYIVRCVYSAAIRPDYPFAPEMVASSEPAFLLHHLLPLRFASLKSPSSTP